MRNKKCLSCGNVSVDNMSICPNCFSAIEEVRSHFDNLPRGFEKKSVIFFGKIQLLTAVVSAVIITISFLISLFLIYLGIAKLKYNIAAIFSIHFVTTFLTTIVSLYTGVLLGRYSAIKWIKMLADKDAYLSKIERTRKMRKIFSPLIITALIFILIQHTLDKIVMFLQIKSLWQQGSFQLLLTHIILGGLIGFSGSQYFFMRWVRNLSK